MLAFPARAGALVACALLAACGGGSEGGKQAGAAAPAVRSAPRSPELAEVRALIERERGDLALPLLERVPGFEAECLRARAQFLVGDSVAALASLTRARALDEHQPETWGTEAELMARMERVRGAAEILATAIARFGPAPALFRAQGVLELHQQGRAAQALEALERARALDPELPFLAWPLSRAHLLVGRARLEHAPAEATAHAMAARALDPLLLDARELEAEGLAGELRFEEALAIYDELAATGRSYGDTPALLAQRCATRCLLAHDRAGAITHYLDARARGLDDEGLGFGLTILAEEHDAALERGLAAAESGDWTAAERAFARALELVPGDLAAENHLGVARFQREDFRGAAEAWAGVLARSRASGTVLPDPVALNLAKAWRLAGERERARAVLSELVDREPDGPWSEAARELLFVLEAEALAER
jgi:tetratricopeptide (TPR) repeat protein